jgi:signal transduction histidine kinase
MRGQPLSLRLAFLLAAAVVAVLLVTGLVVNAVVSRSLEEELSAGQRQRLALVAGAIGQLDLSSPRGRALLKLGLERMAAEIHGRVELRGENGIVSLAAGQMPSGASGQEITEPIPGRDASLVLTMPSGERGFLRIFNLTLLIAGIVAVAVLVSAAALLSDRLTRPLRGVAAAARRLGAGDLGARASGGPDRESAELAEAFNAMAGRLERSEELRRRAASDMAHDLATPATVLESQLQAMIDGIVPAEPDQLDRARASAAVLSGTIVQLRELVDAESAALQRHPEPVSLAELLAESRRAVAPLFRERGVELDGDDPPADLHVLVDAGQVGRALRNVLANAAQHSPRGASVSVTAAREDGVAAVRVADRGPGIAPDDLPHVFERFYRADRARPAGAPQTGSGIGLTIARELLAANDGSIQVERTGPDGTTFLLRLPIAA